jgi:hypothetical protein
MKGRIIALTAALAVCFPATSSGESSRPGADRPRQPVVVKVSQGGFRWGDAAIGAAAASGVALALHGASMLFRPQLRKEEQ